MTSRPPYRPHDGIAGRDDDAVDRGLVAVRQLPLDLPNRTAYDRADFFVSPANAQAFAQVNDPAVWPGGKLVLVGPPGSGKTHLAKVWAMGVTSDRPQCTPTHQLTGHDLRHHPEVFPQAGRLQVMVDDAHTVAGDPLGEEALFHLHNMVVGAGGALLMTAPTPPSRWGVILPDLVSRLQACAVAALNTPDDALLSAVLIKLFADRQVIVPPNLIPYLVSRMERSLAAAECIVALLDREAMSQARPITRALAAELLTNDT